MIVCVTGADTLPQSSVAIHVLVVLKVAGHGPGVVASVNEIAGVGSHASVAVGAVKAGAPTGQSTVELGPWPLNVGGVISWTVIVCVTGADTLPQSSVAVHVLVVLKVPGHGPGVVASVNVIVGVGSHASVAVGAVKAGAPTGQSTVALGP